MSSVDKMMITPDERARHDNQFLQLRPINGLLTGGSARQLFLKSGLPTQILAEIWEIADANKDGMLDKYEFSVAMHLIQRKLQGLDIPTTASVGLGLSSSKMTPINYTEAGSMAYAPNHSSAINGLGPTNHRQPSIAQTPSNNNQASSNGIMADYSKLQIDGSLPGCGSTIISPSHFGIMQGGTAGLTAPSVPSGHSMTHYSTPYTLDSSFNGTTSFNNKSSIMTSSSATTASTYITPNTNPIPSTDWSIPHDLRLKYNQAFMVLDKEKSGYLSGAQAKNVLIQTQLPQTILAQIWNLSDIDADGRLSLEEYFLASYLCDQYKSGRMNSIPAQLPHDLIPPSYRIPPNSLSNGFDTAMTNDSSHTNIEHTVHVPNSLNADQGNQSESQNKVKPLLTYEDRRKENFDKGMAILEQKRLAILSVEKAERDARERKELEEREKVERQRQERERCKQMELELAMDRQKEVERQSDLEKIKFLQQKEVVRMGQEKKRQEDLVASNLVELENKLKRERETLSNLKTTTRDLECENLNMEEKVSNMRQTLADTKSVMSKLEEAKGELDTKCETVQNTLQGVFKDSESARLRLKDLLNQRDRTQQIGMGTYESSDNSQKFEHSKATLQSSINTKKAKLEELKASANKHDTNITVKSSALPSFEHISTNTINENSAQPVQPNMNGSQSTEDPFGLPIFVSHANDPFATDFINSFDQEPFYDKSADSKIEPHTRGSNKFVGTPLAKAQDQVRGKINDPFSVTRGEAKSDVRKLGTGEDPFVPLSTSVRSQVKINTDSTSSHKPTGFRSTSDPDGSDPSSDTNKATEQCPYRALFQFDSRSDDEISFKTDDIILVAEDETSEPGWLGGKIGNRVGWFPAAYAQKVTNELGNQTTATSAPGITTLRQVSIPFLTLGNIPEETSSGDSHIYQEPFDVRKAMSLKQSPASTENEELANTLTPTQAVAMYPLESTTDGDLSFLQGDIMNIIKEPDANWWIATLDGKTGYVPKSYVKILSNPNSSRPSSTPAIRPPAGTQNPANTSTSNLSRSETGTPTDRRTSLGTSPIKVGQTPTFSRRKSSGDSWVAFDTAPSPKSQADTLNIGSVTLKDPEMASVGQRYVAIYPYTSTELGDLEFKTGDIILVKESWDNKDGAEWWTGTSLSTGASGNFPSNYVNKETTSNQPDSLTSPPHPLPTHSFTPQKHHQRKSSTGSVSSFTSETTSHKSGSVKKPLETVVAIAPFTASGPEQLSLTGGMIIHVRRKTATGWWEGEISAKAGPSTAGAGGKKLVGWFPGSHVKPVKVLNTDADMKLVGGTLPKSIQQPVNNSRTPNPSSTIPMAISPAQQPVVYTVKALFDYVSNHAGDLNFKQGDLIYVTEKNDANWWTGRSASTSQVGLFPSNYIAPVSVSSASVI